VEKIVEIPVEKIIEVPITIIIEKPVVEEKIIEEEILIETDVFEFNNKSNPEVNEEFEDEILDKNIGIREREL